MRKMTTLVLLLGFTIASSVSADIRALETTELEQVFHKLKYESANNPAIQFASDDFGTAENSGLKTSAMNKKPMGRRSPTKAFLMSALIPGLGQAYNKDYLKAGGFLGIEIVSWLINRDFDKQGDDLRAEFRAFNDVHWSQYKYDSLYLYNVYGLYDDHELPFGSRASHHLPETKTQQYYEMTGKYDQFAWGWDDARLNGDSLQGLIDQAALMEVDGTTGTAPYSARRLQYETMRDNSNKKYKSARRMASVVLVNHLIAGLEAFFDARRHNEQVGRASDGFGAAWNVKADIRSFRAKQDTPFMQLSIKF